MADVLPPTDRQLEVLATIERLRAEHECSPTVREIGAALEISSTNAVADHLHALKKKGLVDWRFASARTLRPTTLGFAYLRARRAA